MAMTGSDRYDCIGRENTRDSHEVRRPVAQISYGSNRDHEYGPFLYYPNQFHLNIEPTDEMSQEYTLHNWESGILSGIFYGSRRIKRTPSNWMIVRLEGRLGSNSMDALAYAATEIVTRNNGANTDVAVASGWVVE
jgi:hypothetical protein